MKSAVEPNLNMLIFYSRRVVVNYRYGVGGVVCASLVFATAAYAEILGKEPGTSSNPKDNVPKKIQRSTPGGGTFGVGGSGPGTRSDDLVDMKKEKPEPVTLDDMEKNVEKTHGGDSAMAAEKLKEKSMQSVNTDKMQKRSRELHSDKTVQGQDLVNGQPMDKQQPANRCAAERGASHK